MRISRALKLQSVIPNASASEAVWKGQFDKVNPVGIYHLEEPYRTAVFGNRKRSLNMDRVYIAQKHLQASGLLGKPTMKPKPLPQDFEIPKLLDTSLDKHFQKIAKEMSSPYLDWAKQYAKVANSFVKDGGGPQIPETWALKSGWTKYTAENPSGESVDFPDCSTLVFDVEVLYKISEFAVMATAVSENSWYSWLSPWLMGESEDFRQLIPLGHEKQVVIGHSVSYDRKRVKEEYDLHANNRFWLDTMSLHIATRGMCSRQRPQWSFFKKNLKARNEMLAEDERQDAEKIYEQQINDPDTTPPWVLGTSLSSLKDVHRHLYPDSDPIDKTQRNYFGTLNREETREKAQELLTYCAHDVVATREIYGPLLDEFLINCPHPVSFAAIGPMSSLLLPIDRSWDTFVENTERIYQESRQGILDKLEHMAEEACKLADDPEALEKVLEDPWLGQLDWTIMPVKMTKPKKKGEEPRPYARQKLPGKPEWYRQLFLSSTHDMKITAKTRLAPILLKLKFMGYTLVWSDKDGWCFHVPIEDVEKSDAFSNLGRAESMPNQPCFKLPHKDGPKARTTNPFVKSLLRYFEDGTLTSDEPVAMDAIRDTVKTSYWVSVRERIFRQMPVYQEHGEEMHIPGKDQGLILPRMIPMGTVTRRAVEDTWLTASNAKKGKLGSELKSKVKAPPGYRIVGADVDSEELWIAGLMGDALFGIHGGSALGWMTLEGSKSEGTDLHSRTAGIMGISRNEAKIFNYGRIYGAGVTFAISLLQQFNPKLSGEEAAKIAQRLYQHTKGANGRTSLFKPQKVYYGGSESVVFNMLERLAEQDCQRTPILGCYITHGLRRGNLGDKFFGNFMTSRVNWSIQSSGVDYLHLLVVSMKYLCDVYHINARLMLTVHDEVRYLAKEEDALRCAHALQIANLWTRAMFSEQMGLEDLPASVAFFSAVDVDHVLRKEVDDPCVTPSNLEPIEPGKAYDINEILAECKSLGTADEQIVARYKRQPAVEREKVVETMPENEQPEAYLQLQIASSLTEFNEVQSRTRAFRRIIAKSRANQAQKEASSVRVGS